MRKVTFAIAAAAVAACSDNPSRVTSPLFHPESPRATIIAADGNPAPSGGDRIILDTRASLQAATSLAQAEALFRGNDHTPARGAAGGLGWSFVKNFDGAGTNALRADWPSAKKCSDQTNRIIEYIPDPLPTNLYVQWKVRFGRHPNDGAGNGGANAYTIENSACPTASAWGMVVSRDIDDGGGDFKLWYVGSPQATANLQQDALGDQFVSGNQGWSFSPSQAAGRTVEFTVYMQAESAANARDGVLRVWIDGKLFFEKTGLALGTRGMDTFSLPGWRYGTVAESEYIYDVLSWATSFAPATTLTIAPTAPAIDVGGSVQLSASAFDAGNHSVPTGAVKWSTADPKIATVDGDGTVKGKNAGTVAITATAGKLVATVNVTVNSRDPVKIVVTPATSTIGIGDKTQLTATAYDALGRVTDADNIKWSSSSDKIAKVDGQGRVTGVAGGSATITASAGKLSGTASVIVNLPVPTTITIKPSTATINVGDKVQLNATVFDANSKPIDHIDVKWSTSDIKIATVDDDGTVRGTGAGTATITAAVGAVTATAKVTVNAPGPKVTFTVALASSTLLIGQTTQATATLTTPAGTVQSMGVLQPYWTSSNTAVATVSSTGVVKAVSAGTTNIIAKIGDLTGQTALTVSAPTKDPQPGPGATIFLDLRKSLQTATTIDQAFALFGIVDHTDYRAAPGGSGWSFTTNADGNGLHAFRADWAAAPTDGDQGIRVVDYLPSPQTELYVQWKNRVGAYPNDHDANGLANTYPTFATGTPLTACKRALFGDGTDRRIDYVLNRSNPEFPRLEIGGTVGYLRFGDLSWNFDSEIGAPPFTTTVHIKKASSDVATDGVFQLWVNGDLTIDQHDVPAGASGITDWSFPTTCVNMTAAASEYFFDVVVWKP